MRIVPLLLLAAFSASAIRPQQPQADADEARDNELPAVTMFDGGVSQVLQSIYIPPIQNAPFSATIHTQWIRPLEDGGTFTLVNQRQVARDSLGRIYEERWFLVPKNGKVRSQMYIIQIGDPTAHTLFTCFLLKMPHRCTLERYAASTTASYRPPSMASGPLPNGNGFRTHEDLGLQDIVGTETTRTRDTITYNAGVIGNDKPFNVTREFWFASKLEIDLRSELTDPKFGKEIFTVSDVNALDPDPKLFEIPEGFEVVDQRKPAAPAQ